MIKGVENFSWKDRIWLSWSSEISGFCSKILISVISRDLTSVSGSKKFISMKVYIEAYIALIKKTPIPILIESPRDKTPLLVFL